MRGKRTAHAARRIRARPSAAGIGIVGIACFAATVSLLAQSDPGAGGNAARGAQLYYEHGCYGCHGFNGQTGARDLVGTNSPIIADLETFTLFMRLRADQAPLLPSTRMPNYPDSALSDTEVRDIFAFVSTFELDAPEVDDIEAFRAILDSAARPYRP